MIGAGSLVTKDVPDYGLVYGSPAKLEGYVCECGSKLEDLYCMRCELGFNMIDSAKNVIEKIAYDTNDSIFRFKSYQCSI